MEKLNTSNVEAKDASLHAGHTRSLDEVLEPASANHQVDDPETDDLRAQVQKELARTDSNITNAERNVRSAEAYIDRAKENKSEQAEGAYGNGSEARNTSTVPSTAGKSSQAGSSPGQGSSKDLATSSTPTNRSAANVSRTRSVSETERSDRIREEDPPEIPGLTESPQQTRNNPNDSHFGQGQEQQSNSGALSLPWPLLLLILAGS